MINLLVVLFKSSKYYAFYRDFKIVFDFSGLLNWEIFSVDVFKQAIGCQKEIKKTLGVTSKTHAYLKFEMTSYVKCQIDL